MHVQNVNTLTKVVTEEKHTNLAEEAAETTKQQAQVRAYFRGEELAKAVWGGKKDNLWSFDPIDFDWDDVQVVENWNDILSFKDFLHDRVKFDAFSLFNLLFSYSLQRKYSARLCAMARLLATPVISIKTLKQSLRASISLLFGMCSSNVSYIYSAIFGSSSNRIFSI